MPVYSMPQMNMMNLQNPQQQFQNLGMNQLQNQVPQQFASSSRVSDKKNVLFVGDLRKEVTMDNLQSQFSQLKVKFSILHLKSSRGPYQIAFVKFESLEDAEEARTKFNHFKLYNKPMRVLHMKSKEELEKMNQEKSNLIVKQLEKTVTGFQMDQLFSSFGKIVSSKIASDQDGNSLQYGYIQYEREEEANRCLEAHQAQSLELASQSLQVDLFKDNNLKELTTNNLYLKNFPKECTVEQVENKCIEVFSKYGKVNSSRFIISQKFQSRVMGFICYNESEAANQAFQSLDKADLFGTGDLLQVSWFQKKGDRERQLKKELFYNGRQNNLFLKNILETVTQDQLKEVFQKYGEISMFDLKRPADPRIISQYGYVAFKQEKDAKSAKQMSSSDPEMTSLFSSGKVFVQFWIPKGKLAKQREMMRQQKSNNGGQDQMQQFMHMFNSMFGNGMMGGNQMNMNMNRMPMNMNMMNQQMGMNNMMGGQRVVNQPPINPQLFNKHPQINNIIRPQQNMMQQQNIINPQIINQPINNRPQNLNYMPNQNQIKQAQQQQQQQPKVLKNKSQFSSSQDIINNIELFKQQSQEYQRKILGEQLYPKVSQLINVQNPESAALVPKITGMLIDFEVFEVEEIINFFSDSDTLRERIAEAQELLEESTQKE